MDGRKIPPEMENPFDSFLISLAIKMNAKLHPMGITPNMLTVVSFIFGLVSVFYAYKSKFTICAVFFMISYYFDCADGNMARTYNQVTKLGDFLDHATDVIVGTLLFAIVITNKKIKHKWLYAIVVLTIIAAMTVHLGCQERVYGTEQSACLSCLKLLCPSNEYIHVTRWFGCGTLILTLTVMFVVFDLLRAFDS